MPQYCTSVDPITGKRCTTRASYGILGNLPICCKKHMVLHPRGKEMENLSSPTCQWKDEDNNRCKTQPSFGYRKNNKKLYCQKHKKDDMVNLTIKLCSFKDCQNQAKFTERNKKINKFCEDHATEDMINIRNRICQYDGKCKAYAGWNLPDKSGKWLCSKHCNPKTMILVYKNYCQHQDCKPKMACYNFEGEKKGIFCAEHKEPNMINVAFIPCKGSTKEVPCGNYPKFNYEGEKTGRYCATHKLSRMINLEKPNCREKGCQMTPSFNFKGETQALYCSKHQKSKMINVVRKRCAEAECEISASYNLPGLPPKYCFTHKTDDMLLCKPKCIYAGCKLIPSFNFPGERPLYCAKHCSDPGMVNVKKEKCLKCDVVPHYNNYGEKKGIYCFAHKEKGMVDIKNRRCQFEGCQGDKNNQAVPKLAFYNYETEPTAIFCNEHKEDEMISVVVKRCEEKNCKFQATYNYPGGVSRFCGHHKRSGMILFPYRKCIYQNCDQHASYGLSETTCEYCEEHAPDDYFSLLTVTCKKCNLIDIVDDNGLCMYCNPNAKKQAALAKQRRVVAWLNESEHTDYQLIDRVPSELKECTDYYRPDIFYDLGDRYVIIEVDEKQHKGDEYQRCDLPRMINIQQDLALPTIFIRYNPDNYRVDGKIRKIDYERRKKVLFAWIKDAKTRELKDQLSVLYLYYDGFIQNKGEYEVIDIFQTAKKLVSKS